MSLNASTVLHPLTAVCVCWNKKYWLWLLVSQERPPEQTGAAAATRSRRRSGPHGTPQSQTAATHRCRSTPHVNSVCFHTSRPHPLSLWFPVLTGAESCNTYQVSESSSYLLRDNQKGERVPVLQHLCYLDVMTVDTQRRRHFLCFLLKLKWSC